MEFRHLYHKTSTENKNLNVLELNHKKHLQYCQLHKNHQMPSAGFEPNCLQHMDVFVWNYLNFSLFTVKSVRSLKPED